jgi:hypothetical protein
VTLISMSLLLLRLRRELADVLDGDHLCDTTKRP